MSAQEAAARAAEDKAEDKVEDKAEDDAEGADEAALDDAGTFGPSVYDRAPRSGNFNKLRKRLIRQTREAMDAYAMTPKPGETAKWLVCLSGGKDSHAMLAVLLDLQWRGLLPGVELLACNLDQGQPGFPKHVLPDHLERLGVQHRIEYKDTYSIVIDKVPENKTYCALCSRLRRGHLYRIAREEGCDAVVLGHHRDDMLTTFFMNLFHGGRLATMPPKLLNEEGDLLVLRPLAYCEEADLARFSAAIEAPIIPCDLCGTQEDLQRRVISGMLDDWERKQPGRKNVLFRSLTNARPSHLLDPKLFDFAGLAPKIEPKMEPEMELKSAPETD